MILLSSVVLCSSIVCIRGCIHRASVSKAWWVVTVPSGYALWGLGSQPGGNANLEELRMAMLRMFETRRALGLHLTETHESSLSDWDLENLQEHSSQFFEFEVHRQIRKDIGKPLTHWCNSIHPLSGLLAQRMQKQRTYYKSRRVSNTLETDCRRRKAWCLLSTWHPEIFN